MSDGASGADYANDQEPNRMGDKEGITKNHQIARQAGIGLLLQILGGLLLAGLVSAAGSFVKAFLKPYCTGFHDVLFDPNVFALLLAHLAYLGYLFNVFRQVHGLAITSSDKQYIDDVDEKLTHSERLSSLMCLVGVLSLPAMLVALLQAPGESPFSLLISKLRDSLPFQFDVSGPIWVLIVYFLTVLCYFVWDNLSYTNLLNNLNSSRSLSHKWHTLVFDASDYGGYIQNWRALSYYNIVLALFVWIVLTSLYTLGVQTDLFDSKFLAPIVIILTFSYLIGDYTLNHDFYFGNATGRFYDKKSEKEGKMAKISSARKVGLVISILVVVAGTIFMYKSATSAPKTPSVTLQLKWVYNAGFAGDLVAKNKQLWQNLDVKIQEGGTAIDPIKAVTSGRAEFGVATGDQLLNARNNGVPIVAIALAYRINPLSWIVKETSGIRTPSDLNGKKVGLTYIDDEGLFNAMIKAAYVKPNAVTIVPVKFDLSPFYTGAVDAYPVYRNTQGIEIGMNLVKENVQTHLIGPSDLNIVSYSNLYFTTEDYIKSNPKVVAEFVRGVIKGWQTVRDNNNIQEVSKIVSEYDKTTDPKVIAASVQETAKLLGNDETARIGDMSLEGWQKTQDVLVGLGKFEKLPDLISVFTNDFVNQAYLAVKK